MPWDGSSEVGQVYAGPVEFCVEGGLQENLSLQTLTSL